MMMDTFWNQEVEKETIQLMQDLIRIRTINSEKNEILAVQYIAHLFKKAGIPYEVIESAPGRGNIIATIKGGTEKPIIMLSHLDVVDVDYKAWKHDPFAAVIDNDEIFGRGTLDTKQMTVMGLVTMLLVKRNQLNLNRDLIFIATADEENGSQYGMGFLSEKYAHLWENAYVLNEGGGFVLPNLNEKFRICASGEKGVCDITFKLKKDQHLVMKLNRILEIVTTYQSDIVTCRVVNEFYRLAGQYINHDKTIQNLWQYMSHNTLTIKGFNIDLKDGDTKDEEQIVVTFRFLPIYSKEQVLTFIDERFKSCGADYEVTKFISGYESNIDDGFVKILQEVANQYDTQARILPMIALGNTDGRFIGKDVYGYSPLLEQDSFDIVLQKVHGHNESITVESLLYGTRVTLESVLTLACGGWIGGQS